MNIESFMERIIILEEENKRAAEIEKSLKQAASLNLNDSVNTTKQTKKNRSSNRSVKQPK